MTGTAAGAAGGGQGPDPTSGTSRRVTYVMTIYPQRFATFIASEIQALQARGVQVFPVAMNTPEQSDLAGAHQRYERNRTFYLKAQRPWRVLLALLRALQASPIGLAKTFWLGIRTARFDVKAALWSVFHVIEAVLVWDHCRRSGVRHIHAHFGLTPATIAWFASTFGNASGERWTWSFTIHGFQDFVDERAAALAAKAASALYVVCVSHFTRSQIMRVSSPRHWDRFHVVRCGLDLDRFGFAPSQRLADPPTILVVGRLSPEKGHGVLLEALGLLRREGTDAILEFAGDGGSRQQLEDQAGRLGLSDRVRFLGGLDPTEIPERLRHADVLCLPSFSEGLPVSIMEAMAVGTPVLTTYVGGIPELAIDGETALVVPAGDAGLLAAALGRLLRDGGLRRHLVQEARRRVERQHALPETARLLEALLSTTAACPARSAEGAPRAGTGMAPKGSRA